MIQFFPSREVFIALGPVLVHWYGIMYALAFLLGMWLLPRLLKIAKLPLSSQDRETLSLWVFLGVLFGGRLGFVLFYGGRYYLSHPLKIFAVWEGGMSSHGGFIGVLLSLIIFSARRHIDFFRLADVIVIPAAIGLAFGRLGNLINGELYGTVTSYPWGMSFPGAEGTRHPTQIYAIMKDLLIAFVCFLHFSHFAKKNSASGRTAGTFLVMYGVLRFFVEYFRDQPNEYSSLLGITMSPGQLLTLPVILLGVVVLVMRRKSSKIS